MPEQGFALPCLCLFTSFPSSFVAFLLHPGLLANTGKHMHRYICLCVYCKFQPKSIHYLKVMNDSNKGFKLGLMNQFGVVVKELE